LDKLIITLAATGNVPTRAINSYAPLTPDEIVRDVKECVELGISVAHIHARDNELNPTCDREVYKTILEKLDAENVNVIRQLSTGARGGGQDKEYRGQMLDLNAEMASLATGSSNFAKSINGNSFELIEYLANKMNDNNIKYEIEAFDLSMISNAEYLKKKGVLKGNLQFNLVMNVPGSIQGTPKNLLTMVESLPKGSTWTVSGIGSAQVPLLTMAIAMGGNVRTGIEDVIYYEKDVLATNKMLVERVVKIANAVGRKIATVDEAKKILGITKK
jgi:3-keto-5-aminohexanoate cleavage enzyme